MQYAIEPAELVSRLSRYIEDAKLAWELNRPWTVAVKAGLRSILERDLTEVIYTDSTRQTSEFLVDLIAWNRDQGEGIDVAMECEWIQDAKEIVRDFEKLLVIKAPIKLMVFATEARRPEQQVNVFQALERSFLSYKHHVTGERYIFLDFASVPARRAFWFEVERDGRLQGISCRHEIDLQNVHLSAEHA